MADKTLTKVLPETLMIDEGDGSYSLAVEPMEGVGAGDTTFALVLPPTKAVNYGDGTYLVRVEERYS